MRDAVATTPTTVVGAYLTTVSGSSDNTANGAGFVSMRSFLVLDPLAASKPEELGPRVAADVVAASGASPLNVTLAVWNAGLSSNLPPGITVRSAAAAGLAVGAPAEAFSALTDLAVSTQSLGVKESVSSLAQGLLHVSNDSATIASVMSAGISAVSSKALMQSLNGSLARRLSSHENLDQAAVRGDLVAEVASNFSDQIALQERPCENL